MPKAVTPSKRRAHEQIVDGLPALRTKTQSRIAWLLGGNNELGLSLGCAFSGKSRKSLRMWWPETGSNRRRRPFQGRALPLSYLALA